MFPGIGTVLNIATILLGSVIGIFIGERLKDKTRGLITDILGMVTLLGAASAIIPLFKDQYLSAIPKGWSTMPVLIALLLGGIIGSALKLEDRVEHLGEYLRKRFKSEEGSFVEGFLNSSLLFAIGPLAILGSISDGMGTGVDQLTLKSTLDGFAAITCIILNSDEQNFRDTILFYPNPASDFISFTPFNSIEKYEIVSSFDKNNLFEKLFPNKLESKNIDLFGTESAEIKILKDEKDKNLEYQEP